MVGLLLKNPDHTCCGVNANRPNCNYNINTCTKKGEMQIITASIKNGIVVWTINFDFQVFVPDYSLYVYYVHYTRACISMIRKICFSYSLSVNFCKVDMEFSF